MLRAQRYAPLLLAIGLVWTAGPAAAGDFTYVGAKKCKTCHKKELMGNQWQAWLDSKHAKAYDTLKTPEAAKAAEERGITAPAHQAPECLECHATASGLEPSQLRGKPLEVQDGVQCESCHGPGSGYRKKKIMSDRDQAVAKGLILPKADTCTGCHNDKSPAWDPERYTLPDGTKAGFDFDQAVAAIAHPIPEDVKGHYIEREKAAKEAAKKK